MKQKSEPRQSSSSTLIKHVLLGLIVFLALFCLYYGSFLAPHSPKLHDQDSTLDPFVGSFVDDSGYKLQPEDVDSLVPKSIPVCFSSQFA